MSPLLAVLSIILIPFTASVSAPASGPIALNPQSHAAAAAAAAINPQDHSHLIHAASDPLSPGVLFEAWSGPAFRLFGVVAVQPWVLGLLFAIVGYTLCGLGMNLIKLSHIKNSPRMPSTLRETKYNARTSRTRVRVLWVCGYGVNSLGGSLNIAGLRFAAQSMLAPLSSMALLANIVFATVLLGERLSLATDAAPMLLIACGNMLTVASANHSAYKNLSLEGISKLFGRPQFHWYLSVVSIFIVALLILRHRIRSQIRRNGGKEYASPNLIARAGLYHAGAGCMLSVHLVFLSKASMLALAEGLHNALRPKFAILILTWLTLAVFWIYTLNRLLGEYDALFIIPVIEVVWSLQSMISGGIFFNEYSSLTWLRWLGFVSGVLVNICGVYLLSRRGERLKKLAK